jgi:hypothetical protein
MPITVRDCIPRDWTELLGTGPIGIGGDLATTEKETSNPSSITVTQKEGPFYVERLVVSWKSKSEVISRAMFWTVCMDIKLAKHRPRRICLDATNERFFAQDLQKRLNVFCPVELVVASETMEWQGQGKMTMKTILGNLYVNDFNDAIVRIPNESFLKEDHRLVKKDKGLFIAGVSPDGMHGDTFDSGKLARWALERGGPVELEAVPVGNVSGGKSLPYHQLKNPLLRQAQRQRQRTHHA